MNTGGMISGIGTGASAGSAAGPWGSVIGGAIGGVAGAIGKSDSAKNKELTNQQVEASKELMNQQNQNSKELFDYQYNRTGISGQMRELKAEGLNPALMYKGVPNPGGSASASSSGAMASRGDLPMSTDVAGSMLGMAQLKSQIDLNESQAKKNLAEAEKVAGVDTEVAKTNIEKIIEDTKNVKVKTELESIDRDIKSMTATDVIANQQWITKLRRLESQMSEDTYEATRDTVVAEYAGRLLENKMTQSKIELTNEQMKAISEELKQGWAEIRTKIQGVRASERSNIINEFSAKVKAAYPGITQMGGRIINDVIYDISEELDKELK